MEVMSRHSGSWISSTFEDVAIRVGVYTGLTLSIIFVAWLMVANRMPELSGFAVPRNVIGASLLTIVGAIPVFRFFRSPSELLLSSVVGWGMFTLTYAGLCLKFEMLDQYYSTSQIFVLGSLIYLVLATLCWIGTIIWRVRATDSSHPRH
jgi:hypothetical protein